MAPVSGPAAAGVPSLDGDPLRPPAPGELVGHPDAAGRRLGDAPHPGDPVRLVVEEAGHPRDHPARHQLPDEHDAPPIAVADVKAEVHLGKAREPRPGHAQDARVEEVEGHETHERLALPPVESQASGNAREEDPIGHGIRHEGNVDPAGGQERAPGAIALSQRGTDP